MHEDREITQFTGHSVDVSHIESENYDDDDAISN